MYKQRFPLKDIISYFNEPNYRNLRLLSSTVKAPEEFQIKKVLVLSKISFYENERSKLSKLSEQEFRKYLEARGSDYDLLLHYHNLHKQYVKEVLGTLKKHNLEFKVATRYNYKNDLIKWADMVMPVGGDGTFLFVAGKILNHEKPVVGFNSNPKRSEGHLCLPKLYSSRTSEAIERLKNGKYQWLLRSRIRIKLFGDLCEVIPAHLHFEYYFDEAEHRKMNKRTSTDTVVLPYLALNEVFIGEQVAARVSNLKMWLNDSQQATSMKSSGLCVSTGTGSTSWHLSINRLTAHTVAELLKLVNYKENDENSDVVKNITDTYNKNLIFAPDKDEMAYSVRELITVGVWPNPKGLEPRGFAKKIRIKSKCSNARLVIDGGISYSFNDGCLTILEIHPEDALRTVVFND